MCTAIIFGASDTGKRIFGNVAKKYNILAITDNDSRKWGQYLQGVKIISPVEAVKLCADVYIIASLPGLKAIKKQLNELQIDESKIDDSYVISPLESRRVFLEKYSLLLNEWEEEGSVAEAGVFEGDFAEYINEYFPTKRCHLFDTFEGFDERDLKKEGEFSEALVGDYSNTSISMVMEKMKYPEMVVIHKGFFPETAKGIEERFCFVNLDLDLYEPTYAGLLFFENRMTKHGIILVHDYFARNFRGPKEAVDRYLSERPSARILPIGDGISIMVIPDNKCEG